MSLTDKFEVELNEVTREIRDMLLSKNKAYGDSALNPIRCFSKSDTLEQLSVRIDDKLSRLMRGSAAGEDCILDMIGYLMLYRIQTKRIAAMKNNYDPT